MEHGPKLHVAPHGERGILFTRRFDAPRDRIFAALTTPALVRRWLTGPPGMTMPECEIDLRPGGAYRYLWRMADGTEMGAGGTFLEIAPPARLVHTERFDTPWYPGEAVINTDLAERDDGTEFTALLLYESAGARDTVLRSGMEAGVAPSYDRLEALARAPGA